MYNHALALYRAFQDKLTVDRYVPYAELKLMGMLPFPCNDAIRLHEMIAPNETMDEFYHQEAGEQNKLAGRALKAGFAARWDGYGGDAFSALFICLMEYVEYHTGSGIYAELNKEYRNGFFRLLLMVLGAGRALGVHEERERRRKTAP